MTSHTTIREKLRQLSLNTETLACATYTSLMMILLPLIVLGFVLRSFKQSAYRARLNERLGLGAPLTKHGIIFHGASVGEIISLTPVIEAALAQFSQHPIIVTSFTPTGSSQIHKRFGKRVQHCYIPIDTPWCSARFLANAKPKVLVLMETELWPNLILTAKKTGVKILLINGRISPRSYPKYHKIRALISPSLRAIETIQAQSQADADRFISLGANPKHCTFSGNIKYDITIPDDITARANAARSALEKRKVCVVGSSHQDEEALIFDCLEQLKMHIPGLLFIIAPRHPERYQALRDEASKRNLALVSRSERERLPQQQELIWLIDTMGELLVFYSLADICIVAGSFGTTGGHNPIEAALFSKAIIVGPNTKNFKDPSESLLQAGGLIQLSNSSADTLAATVKTLLEQPQQAEQLGDNAYREIHKNRGATQRVLAALDNMTGEAL